MKNYIVILDGSKGAGKSTTSNFLKKKLEDTAFLSLDLMRRIISGSKANTHYNEISFKALMKLSEEYLVNKINIVLDTGLTRNRLEEVRIFSKKMNVELYLFFLNTSKETSWKRVQERDIVEGKISNKERHDYIYEKIRDKNFTEYIEIDTSVNSPEQVSKKIESTIKNINL